MLKRLNDALPELVLGIIVYGIVVELAGVWFVTDKLRYTTGLVDVYKRQRTSSRPHYLTEQIKRKRGAGGNFKSFLCERTFGCGSDFCKY